MSSKLACIFSRPTGPLLFDHIMELHNATDALGFPEKVEGLIYFGKGQTMGAILFQSEDKIAVMMNGRGRGPWSTDITCVNSAALF